MPRNINELILNTKWRTFCRVWKDCFLIQFVSLPCFSISTWMLVLPFPHGMNKLKILWFSFFYYQIWENAAVRKKNNKRSISIIRKNKDIRIVLGYIYSSESSYKETITKRMLMIQEMIFSHLGCLIRIDWIGTTFKNEYQLNRLNLCIHLCFFFCEMMVVTIGDGFYTHRW